MCTNMSIFNSKSELLYDNYNYSYISRNVRNVSLKYLECGESSKELTRKVFLDPLSRTIYSCFVFVLLADQITVIGMKKVLKHRYLQIFGFKLDKYEHF